jgi:phosphatidylinositol-3-phosphatase
MRRLLILLALIVALHPATAAAAPPLHHVFVIVLENKDAAITFGPGSAAPYLAQTLPAQGAFLPNYYGIGHASLDNYLAMISGQAPNIATQADCPLFVDVLPGLPVADGQVFGQGCVYPASVATLADQLEANGFTWKGYMEDMGNDPARDGGTTCAHPALGTPDRSQQASASDQYATRHDPFVYFHSIIDDAAGCAARVVPLDRLAADLGSAATTPNLAFITPDLCHDAHDATCADGTAGGLPAADAFLREWVPRITGSPAFADGLLVITFDEAGSDSSACCGEQSGPNTPAPGGQSGGPGGGRTGTVLVSPAIAAQTTTTRAYNHYSLLRSLEDLFGLAHLGYAGAPGLEPFGPDVYTAP